MTGAEIHKQVENALVDAAGALGILPGSPAWDAPGGRDEMRAAIDALAPCIVLTAEEAAQLRLLIERATLMRMPYDRDVYLALLTSDQEPEGKFWEDA